jgi:hypothetical protein
MRRLWTALAVGILVAAMAAPASAITRGGTLDGEDHPYVGLMVANVDGAPAWRCSGALISPTLYVTAGHCTFGADGATLWFESDVEQDRVELGYPFSGGPTSVTGTPVTHPEYLDEAFFLYDLGVVVLDEPIALDGYASLPTPGAVDDIPPGRRSATVTAVGYGLQSVKPTLTADLTRYQADLMVVDTRGVAGLGRYARAFEDASSFVVSGDARHGGTCFGDSGGPILRGDTIMGVISFGLNANCAGIGGIYRVDKATDLAFIRDPLPR